MEKVARDENWQRLHDCLSCWRSTLYSILHMTQPNRHIIQANRKIVFAVKTKHRKEIAKENNITLPLPISSISNTLTGHVFTSFSASLSSTSSNKTIYRWWINYWKQWQKKNKSKTGERSFNCSIKIPHLRKHPIPGSRNWGPLCMCFTNAFNSMCF